MNRPPLTRPHVTWKVATSLDGRIATSSGESKWITGEAARTEGHRLRAASDAILVGVETVLADDPRLTTRLSEGGADPLRVILDSRLRTPEFARVAVPGTLILTTAEARPVGGAEVVRVAKDANGRVDVGAALDVLAARGVGRLMVEGGGRVAAAFVAAGLVDAIEWFRAPILLGADGRPCLGLLALKRLGDAPRYRRLAVELLDDDLWERLEQVG
ncbi:RibD family protein [Brevundimonas balnearis]|uniref:RibD family protein n=1 Tax=Brevundimonas balnearis TaxID=1572858 RepID=A0ABV6QYW8_9CAUL